MLTEKCCGKFLAYYYYHKGRRNSDWLSTCNNLIHTAQSINSGAREDNLIMISVNQIQENTNASRSISESTKQQKSFVESLFSFPACKNEMH
jgi:hypothetical protein